MSRLLAKCTSMLIVTASVPIAAIAAPTYLTCAVSLPGNGPTTDEKFALNESTAIAAITFPTGRTESSRATFAAATVSFSDGVFQWQIDRTTLRAQARPIMGRELMGALAAVCKIDEPPPKRAF